MPESKFKNSNSLKGGNYWQNYIGKKSLYNSEQSTFNTSYPNKKDSSSIFDKLEKSIDFKKIAGSLGKRGSFVFPTGRLLGPSSGMLSGKWDVRNKSPLKHSAKLKYSWSI